MSKLQFYIIIGCCVLGFLSVGVSVHIRLKQIQVIAEKESAVWVVHDTVEVSAPSTDANVTILFNYEKP